MTPGLGFEELPEGIASPPWAGRNSGVASHTAQ